LGGGALVHEFAASAKLEEVQRFVEGQTSSPDGSCILMTSFPKHVFTREEADKTLQELSQYYITHKNIIKILCAGLVPSSVLIQTKATL
jgi:hypothetical protein